MSETSPVLTDQLVGAMSPLETHSIQSKPVWDELRTFLALAKSRSLTQAAELSNSSTATVSRKMKRLQDQIGAQLFVLRHDGVRLTPKGVQLAEQVARMDHFLANLFNDLGSEREQLAGRVVLSVSLGLAALMVAPAMADMENRHPLLEIELKDQVSFANFERNLADVMVSLIPISRADVSCERIGTLHMIPVISRAYISRHERPRRGTLGDHLVMQCSYYMGESPVWSDWNELVASSRNKGRHVFENSLAYFTAIKSGGGIGLLGNYVLADPNLLPLDFGVHVAIPIYVVVLTDRLQSKPVRIVHDWIVDMFQSNPMFGEELVVNASAHPHTEPWHTIFNVPR